MQSPGVVEVAHCLDKWQMVADFPEVLLHEQVLALYSQPSCPFLTFDSHPMEILLARFLIAPAWLVAGWSVAGQKARRFVACGLEAPWC